MDTLLALLDKNARLSLSQLAAAAGDSEQAVAARIEAYERAGVIRGYKTLIDWDKTDRDYLTARIELKVSPKRDMGFDEIAGVIAGFEEVETVYLMSGSYDLALTVAGRTFKDVALFVAQKLSTLDSVQSTATSFVLRKYKERGILIRHDRDVREVTTL
jgi:DNA-binding Lrp family transcriptional regulator